MKVIITSDSSCDLSPEQIKENNIPIIPIYVNLNGEEFRDGVNITPEDIFAFVKENKKLPKTSAVSIADYKLFFENILKENPDAEIVHIGLSSQLSTSFNNSVAASEELNGKVISVDGKNLSTGTGLLVLYACKLAKEGLSKEEIAKKVEARVPFADTKLIEYLWNIPWNYKYYNNQEKGLLRESFKQILPEYPSLTTTSTLPRRTSLASMLPIKLSFEFFNN